MMTYVEALKIVNDYGCKHDCDSLMDCIAEMEDNTFELTNDQFTAMQVVLGELVFYHLA